MKRSITFDTVRDMGLAMPGVEESTSYGTPALKIKGKLFARLKEDGESLVVRTTAYERDELIGGEPKIYYITDHYLNYPWVLVHLSRVHRDALRDLLLRARQLAATTARKRKRA
jgi:hypothetical protein